MRRWIWPTFFTPAPMKSKAGRFDEVPVVCNGMVWWRRRSGNRRRTLVLYTAYWASSVRGALLPALLVVAFYVLKENNTTGKAFYSRPFPFAKDAPFQTQARQTPSALQCGSSSSHVRKQATGWVYPEGNTWCSISCYRSQIRKQGSRHPPRRGRQFSPRSLSMVCYRPSGRATTAQSQLGLSETRNRQKS
jgi:hypothetical protein